ncbi:MAG: hypothetical protein Q7I99_05085, partial [Acholeplasmataceae bacterium]|nr:hypothetical protein [Acholeplasmataceae bacterium]
ETLYLAKKPNSNDIYIYDFDRTELLKIEEEFAYTSMKYNHLIINKRRCEILYCQDIYKDGTELILSDVLLFKSINKENAIYVDNISDTSYDIMHINFTTKITKKILSLNYSNDPYINFNPVFIAYNNLFTIKDDETGDYHIYDEHGVLIETTTFISRYKTSAGSSKYYLQRDNGEIILFNLYG